MSEDRDAFLQALDDLDVALEQNLEMTARMRRRIEEIRMGFAGGGLLREIVPKEDTPLLVQLLTRSTNLLHAYGTRVRRTEARTLYDEGMTMDEIARLFGVSRQRVSALLRARPRDA